MSAQTPDADHRLKGTRPTRAAAFDADLPAGRPKLPKDLSAESRKVFKLLVKQLEARRTCTEGDRQILHLYAELHTRWTRAKAKVAEMDDVVIDFRLDSNGESHQVLRKNPWLLIAQESEKQMASILRDLGLTPNSRKAVKPLGKSKSTPLDPMEAWAETGIFPEEDITQ